MQRIAAGLLVALTLAGCQPSDARPDAGPGTRASTFGGAAGAVRPGQVTARLEQILWDQRAPAYVRGDLWHLVRTSYDRRQYQPYWVGAGAPGRAAALVGAVCRAEAEGLRSADYQMERLASELEALRRSRTADRLGDMDLLLTAALFAYGEDLLIGRVEPGSVAPEWDAAAPRSAADSVLQATLAGTAPLDSALSALRPRSPAYDALIAELAVLRSADAAGGWAEIPEDQVLRRGIRGPAVDALRRRLAATGELAARDSMPGRAFGRPLAAAVARFQERHGLAADGVAGPATIAAMNVPVALRIAQVEANLERYRWIPENLIPRYVLFEMTAGRLAMVSNGVITEMDARLDDDVRNGLPPVIADTITSVAIGTAAAGPRDRPGPVRLALAHESGTSAGQTVVLERPLELVAFVTGRDVGELRTVLAESAPAPLQFDASLPIFMLAPTVRREGDTVRFPAGISPRDGSIADALGSARPIPPERCDALALSAASAVLSGR